MKRILTLVTTFTFLSIYAFGQEEKTSQDHPTIQENDRKGHTMIVLPPKEKKVEPAIETSAPIPPPVITIRKDNPVPAATTEEKRLKPVEKNWGMTFNISGLLTNFKLEGNKNGLGQPILFAKRYLKDDLVLRMGFGLNSNKNQTVKKDSLRQISAFVSYDSIYKRTDVSFSLGIEKHLDHMRRIDPYFGGEVQLVFIGKETISWTEERKETSGTTNVEGERKTDGGLGMGVFAFAGFNYFIADHISLGAEYRFGYGSTKTGGNFSESIIVNPPSGSSTSTYNKGTDEYKTSGFEVNSSANIVLSIFF